VPPSHENVQVDQSLQPPSIAGGGGGGGNGCRHPLEIYLCVLQRRHTITFYQLIKSFSLMCCTISSVDQLSSSNM
jgi:hypothetical protein